jgi:hypothetical protein
VPNLLNMYGLNPAKRLESYDFQPKAKFSYTVFIKCMEMRGHDMYDLLEKRHNPTLIGRYEIGKNNSSLKIHDITTTQLEISNANDAIDCLNMARENSDFVPSRLTEPKLIIIILTFVKVEYVYRQQKANNLFFVDFKIPSMTRFSQRNFDLHSTFYPFKSCVCEINESAKIYEKTMNIFKEKLRKQAYGELAAQGRKSSFVQQCMNDYKATNSRISKILPVIFTKKCFFFKRKIGFGTNLFLFY